MDLIKNWRGNVKYLSWIFRYVKPYMPKLSILFILNFFTSLVSIVLALINKQIIDKATMSQSIAQSVMAYVVVVLASLLINAVFSVFSTIISERFSFSIRSAVYEKVLKACWKDIGSYHSGDVVTRLTSDIDIIASGISEIIPSIFSLIITFVAAFITLAYFNLEFALLALFLGPIAAIISVVMGRIIRRMQIKVQESESAYKSSLQENISNMVVMKAFEGQDIAVNKLEELRDQRLYWLKKRQTVSALSGSALSGAFQAGYITAFAWSSWQLSKSLITYGTMSVFLSLVSQIQAPLYNLSHLIPRLVLVLTSAGRVMELESLNSEDMRKDEMAAGPLGMRVEDISFSYGSELVLQNASIVINPGETIALMGSSGIGKTTFLRLIMSYYLPQNGEIKLFDSNGKLSAVNAGSRAYMSYVPQGNTLMSGSIADNLRLGRSNATEEEMWEVLRVVIADQFVKETPNGLNTLIGERGLGLSEGQAQRIAIARALIKKAPLLILDEATSALDELTESAVLEHLSKNTPSPTCIIVTHRTSVLKYCTRQFKIKDKRILEG